MRKLMKKHSVLLLLTFTVIMLFSMSASAATIRKVKAQKFTTSRSVANKKAITIKTGTTLLRAKQGYVKFVAPKAGKYKFTFSNMAPYKTTSTNIYESGYWYLMTINGSKNQYVWQQKVPTKAGKSYALKVATPARYNRLDKGNTITTDTYLPTRSGTIRLKKGQLVYLYFSLSTKEWYKFSMKVKRLK